MNLRTHFETHHKGRENAIKRKRLLSYLRTKINPEMTDREMRKQYESLPLCGNNRGLFLPATEEERQKQIRINEEKIRRYEEEIVRLKKYPINGQLRLW